MPRTKSSGMTKKEMKRFNKSELIKMLGGDKNLKKQSKNALVDMAYKRKDLRAMKPKEKRKMTEKQRANLTKWRIQKDYKKEDVIKPKAQYDAEIRKIEDVAHIGRGEPEEFGKKKIGEGNGRFRETQVEKLKQQANTNKDEERVRKREMNRSTNKVEDAFEQAIDSQAQKDRQQRMAIAENQARSKKDVRFGEGENIQQSDVGAKVGTSTSVSILQLLNAPVNDLKAMYEDLSKKDPTNPLVVIIEDLLKKKRNQ